MTLDEEEPEICCHAGIADEIYEMKQKEAESKRRLEKIFSDFITLNSYNKYELSHFILEQFAEVCKEFRAENSDCEGCIFCYFCCQPWQNMNMQHRVMRMKQIEAQKRYIAAGGST